MRTTGTWAAPHTAEPAEPTTTEYHPFARSIDTGEWVVEDPKTHRPLGFVRSRENRETAGTEYVVYPWHDESIVVRAFDGAHATLFEATAWLRWHDDNPD